MVWEKYPYLADDKQLGKKIAFYPEHLENAQRNGHDTLFSWVTSLYNDLQSQAEVGKVIGVTQRTISHWLRSAGVPTRPKGGANNVKKRSLHLSAFKRGNINWNVSSREEVVEFPLHYQIE
jgi:hypothetical protein